MKFREHRGSLDASMDTQVEVDNLEELCDYLNDYVSLIDQTIQIDQLKVEPYGFDKRIDWNTHIVTVEGYGVFGFTDGAVEKGINNEQG